MRSLLRTCSLLTGGLLVVACSDPDLKTDLDTEGAPEVNMITVSHEGAPLSVNGNGFGEAPTFCRADGGRVNREICPVDEASGNRTVASRADVAPVGFQVRAVFSELIDPEVETLEDRDDDGVMEGHIDTTIPGTIDCGGGAIAFDGHYDPSGNDVTAPPGPSLVFAVTDGGGFPAATGSACTFSLDTSKITDKDGTGLPAAEAGPYDFTLANLHFTGSDPEPAFNTMMTPDTADDVLIEIEDLELIDMMGMQVPLVVGFNAPVDMTSIDAADILLEDLTDPNVPVAVVVTVTAAGTDLQIVPTAGWEGVKSYRLTYTAASTILDASASGGAYTAPAEDYVILFKTAPLPDAPDAAPDAA